MPKCQGAKCMKLGRNYPRHLLIAMINPRTGQVTRYCKSCFNELRRVA